MAESNTGVKNLQMLLVEPETLLRRTVSLTARSLGLGHIHEAASMAAAEKLLQARAYHGAVISIDCETRPGENFNLQLLDQVRQGMSVSSSDMPIAVMAAFANAELLQQLRDRDISRVILKPFRARVLLDAFASFETKPGQSKTG